MSSAVFFDVSGKSPGLQEQVVRAIVDPGNHPSNQPQEFWVFQYPDRAEGFRPQIQNPNKYWGLLQSANHYGRDSGHDRRNGVDKDRVEALSTKFVGTDQGGRDKERQVIED
ncbi:hypothetical protein D3C78_1307220 [compost metagenome]